MTLGPHAILTAEAACSDRVADSQPPVACVQTQAQLTSQGTKEGYMTKLQILSRGSVSYHLWCNSLQEEGEAGRHSKDYWVLSPLLPHPLLLRCPLVRRLDMGEKRVGLEGSYGGAWEVSSRAFPSTWSYKLKEVRGLGNSSNKGALHPSRMSSLLCRSLVLRDTRKLGILILQYWKEMPRVSQGR